MTAEEKVLEALMVPMTTFELVKKCGVSKTTVYTALTNLLYKRLIHECGKKLNGTAWAKTYVIGSDTGVMSVIVDDKLPTPRLPFWHDRVFNQQLSQE